jgi:undecaprenyl-diphosphatase
VRDIKLSFAPGLTLAIVGIVLFAWIAMTVSEPQVPAIDLAIRGAIHAEASPALTAAMKVVTQLGGGWFLWPLGASIIWWLVRQNRRRPAAWFVIAALGANIIDESMKLLFQRPRPDPFFGYEKPLTYSFPSGHSFVSFCFYLALAQVLIRPHWPAGRKVGIWIAALLITFCIGFSRVYLGVHYPSDVAGGFAAAFAWTFMMRSARPRFSLGTDALPARLPPRSTTDE